MVAVFDLLSPRGAAAWAWVRRYVLLLAELLLTERLVMHALIAIHLAWEGVKLLGAGNEFAVDPIQYAGMMRAGGEAFWLPFFAGGALTGAAGLVCSRWWIRSFSAVVMGTVERTFVHYLTASGAAPTAGPTYEIFIVACCWLAFAHPLADRIVRRR